jgi:hypothetical protein
MHQVWVFFFGYEFRFEASKSVKARYACQQNLLTILKLVLNGLHYELVSEHDYNLHYLAHN